jgi:hypothetical protein
MQYVACMKIYCDERSNKLFVAGLNCTSLSPASFYSFRRLCYRIIRLLEINSSSEATPEDLQEKMICSARRAFIVSMTTRALRSPVYVLHSAKINSNCQSILYVMRTLNERCHSTSCLHASPLLLRLHIESFS